MMRQILGLVLAGFFSNLCWAASGPSLENAAAFMNSFKTIGDWLAHVERLHLAPAAELNHVREILAHESVDLNTELPKARVQANTIHFGPSPLVRQDEDTFRLANGRLVKFKGAAFDTVFADALRAGRETRVGLFDRVLPRAEAESLVARTRIAVAGSLLIAAYFGYRTFAQARLFTEGLFSRIGAHALEAYVEFLRANATGAIECRGPDYAFSFVDSGKFDWDDYARTATELCETDPTASSEFTKSFCIFAKTEIEWFKHAGKQVLTGRLRKVDEEQLHRTFGRANPPPCTPANALRVESNLQTLMVERERGLADLLVANAAKTGSAPNAVN